MLPSSWTIVRMKGPDALGDVDADDLDWHALGIPPNSARYTVASVEDGIFAVNVRNAEGSTAAIAGTSSFDRAAAENADAVAAALVTAINADIAAGTAGTLYGYAERAIYPGTGAAFYIQWKMRKTFWVSTTAPGSATLTAARDVRFPICVAVPFGKRMESPTGTDVEITITAITSGGVPIAPGSCTYTLEVVEGIQLGGPDGAWSTASRGTIAGAALGDVHGVQCAGAGMLGVVLTTIANEPASTDRLVVQMRSVVA